MYFIEHFLELAQKDGHLEYVRFIQRDIIRVVDAVAPDDGSGAANVKVVRRVCGPLPSCHPLPSTNAATRCYKASNPKTSFKRKPSPKSTKSCASAKPPTWTP